VLTTRILGNVLFNFIVKEGQCTVNDIGTSHQSKIGDPCVFPFKYDGKTHTACTNFKVDVDKYWCSTKTYDNGTAIYRSLSIDDDFTHHYGFFGYCAPHCPRGK